jgi:cold shock CspA family protein
MFTTFAQVFDHFNSAPAAPVARAAHRAKPQQAARFIGSIDNCQAKFGFIQHEDFPTNVFFYVTELAPGLTMEHLAKGTLVDFSTTVRASDGQVIATDVTLHNAVRVAAPKDRYSDYVPKKPIVAVKPLYQQHVPVAATRLTGAVTNASGSHGFIRHEHYPSNVFFHKDGLAIGLLMSDLPEGSMVTFTVASNPKNGEPMAVDIGLPAGVAYASRAHRDRIIGAMAPPPPQPQPQPVARASYQPISYQPPSPPKAPLYAGYASANQRYSPPRPSHNAEYAFGGSGSYGGASAGAHQHYSHTHSHAYTKQPQQQEQPHRHISAAHAQPPRSRSHSPPSHVQAQAQAQSHAAHHVAGPSRVSGAWVVGAEVEADESRVLEFKHVDAKHGDPRAWMRDHLLPKLINGFLNRRPLARESRTALVLFGVTDAGRVVGMHADRQLRDVLIRDVDTIVRQQKAMNGSAGALTGADVVLEFSPAVRRDARTGALHDVPDLFVGELTVQSCFHRCPLYSFTDGGNEVSYERWSGSMRKLTLAEVGARVVAHATASSASASGSGSASAGAAEAEPGSAATAGASSSYHSGRR